jgi:hypothetical protein
MIEDRVDFGRGLSAIWGELLHLVGQDRDEGRLGDKIHH